LHIKVILAVGIEKFIGISEKLQRKRRVRYITQAARFLRDRQRKFWTIIILM